MKTLTVVGTIAMFLVGGSILAHGFPSMHTFTEGAVKVAQSLPVVGGVFGWLAPLLLDAVVGIVAGGAVMGVVVGLSKIVTTLKK
jgi:predicted DNA repair protein MutK